MRTARSPWERNWQDLRQLVRPNTDDFNRTTTVGEVRTASIYDGTAMDACNELASGLHSYLTNPVDQWFSLEIEEMDALQNDPEALLWLEQVSTVIYDMYQKPESRFNTAVHEVYLDLGAFGTACINQEWSYRRNGLLFRATPMADVSLAESSEEEVDTVARQITWTLRQLQQEFDELPEKIAKMCRESKDQDKTVTVVHMVCPRTDRKTHMLDYKNMPYMSVWVCMDTKETLKESGYRSFPYHCPRWMKLAGEVYGRGPGWNCLPDIRMLNRMEFTLIKAGQKAVDPPLVVPDDGFVLPLQTHPGALIYKESGSDEIQALEHKGNLPFGMEQSEQKREFIKKCFYADWLKMEKLDKEMTAYEVQDRRDEKLRMMAPLLGRQETELCGPMIARSYELLSEHNMIPPAPRSLRRRSLKVSYRSPAAKAQTGVKAMAMGRFVQELIPVAQIDPTVMDVIDTDVYAQELAVARGTPRTILRSPKAIQSIRDKRAQQQQVAQVAQLAEPASKAIKNLAEAGRAGGGM